MIRLSEVSSDLAMLRTRFTPDFTDEVSAKAAYLAHNDEVRAAIPADRLLEWHPGDGWDQQGAVARRSHLGGQVRLQAAVDDPEVATKPGEIQA